MRRGSVIQEQRQAILALLLVGVLLWVFLPAGPSGVHAQLPLWRWIVAGAAAIIAVVPRVRPMILRAIRAIEHPSPRTRARAAVAIAFAASVYFVLTAFHQDRDFFPKTHDECSYLIQMRMLAIGRLWMPRHELADFFDSFYVLTTPKYASMYFPGTAMLFVPELWIGWPTWVIPVIVAGAIVGLVYRIVAELVDGAAGALAALLILSLSWFRMLSIMLMSQLPLLLFGLIMVWAWLRWRGSERRPRRWLVLIGACAGWAAITRPLDAVCFALPVAIAIAMDLWRAPVRRRLAAAALVISAAAPFLIVQLILNVGVSGHLLRTPFGLYADRDNPGTSYGFYAPDPARRPQSVIPQKQLAYSLWAKPFIDAHQPAHLASDLWNKRLPLIADVTLPARPLLVLIPIGLLGLRDRRRWVLFAALPLFAAGYLGYSFVLEHYAVVLAPAIALLVNLGVRVVARLSTGHRSQISAAIVSFIVALCLTNSYEVSYAAAKLRNMDPRQATVDDEPFHSSMLRELHKASDADVVILFTFDPSDQNLASKISEEPVYNTDVAWPDDAPIIRAHDLGPRNIEIFRYYSTHGADRIFYRFDRTTHQLSEPLGRASELVRKLEPPERDAK